MEQKHRIAHCGMTPENAFRRFASLGLDKRRLGVFEAYAVIRGVCRRASTATELLAVYDTMRLLSVGGHADCADAVRRVYFEGHGRRPPHSDVTYRVRRAAFESNCDERTIYRRLRYARELYLALRKNEEGFI